MIIGRRRLALAAALSLSATACGGDERRARDYLKRSGYIDVGIEAAEGEGSFSWTGRRGKLLCVGRLAVQRTARSVTIDDRSSCEFDPASCTEAAPQICFVLARMHEVGDADPFDSVRKDAVKSAHFYDTACRGGHARACNALGVQYGEGVGVRRDLTRAATLFEKSCAGRHVRGCFNLGLSHHHGKGVRVDLPRAVGLYDRACREGVGAACYNLGVCHRDGLGQPEDAARAAHAFALGCARNHLQACVNLGAMLVDGESLPVDHARARLVFDKACSGGLQTGCQGLKALPTAL